MSQRNAVRQAFAAHKENFLFFFLNSKTVVHLGCFKGIKLSLFLIFNLKYKPLFIDFSVALGASFFLPGSV